MKAVLEQPTVSTFTAPDEALTRHRAPLHALTGIRFVAAMQVVLFHFGAAFVGRHGAPHIVVHMLQNGFQAVSLFFLLSGFILAYTYAGQMHAAGSVKRFYQARFARIYPVYALSLLCGALLFRPWASDYAYTFTMTQAWNPAEPWRATALNMPAWTLSVEAVFYLLFPLLLSLALHRRIRWLLTAGAALLLLIALGHTTAGSDTLMALSPHDPRHWIPLPLWRVPEFALGLLTGLLFLRTRHHGASAAENSTESAVESALRSRHRSWLNMPGVALLYAAALLDLLILATAGPRWGSLLAIPNVALIYALARASEAVRAPWLARMLSSRPLRLLGGASYAIYLFQLLVRAALERLWTGTGPRREIEIAAAHLTLLLAISIAVFLFYEEPARRTLRRWFARRDSTA